MRTRRITLVLLCFVLPALVSCSPLLPSLTGVQYGAYLAEIERVEPEIPGLIVKETTAVVGEIIVINETGKDIYIVKMGAGKSRYLVYYPRRFLGETKMVSGYT